MQYFWHMGKNRRQKAMERKNRRLADKARIVEHNLALYGYSLDNPPPRGVDVNIKHWFLFLRNYKRRERLIESPNDEKQSTVHP